MGNERCNRLLMTNLLRSHGLVAVFCASDGVHSMQGSHRCEGTSSNVHQIVENGSFCASGSSKWQDLGLKRQKSSTDRFHVFFLTGWQGFIASEAAIRERKDRHGDGGHIGDMAKFCLLSKKEQSLLCCSWLCKHHVIQCI
jgi:hypothetical protein